MRRLTTIGAAALVLALPLAQPAAAAGRSSGSAAAACSGYSWSDRDPGSAQVINKVQGLDGVNMRNGSASYCDWVTTVPWFHWVVLDCYTSGTTVNGVSTWSHVRYSNGGPVHSGWISDYYLSDRGSNYRCPG
jgi:hypothetical protein